MPSVLSLLSMRMMTGRKLMEKEKGGGRWAAEVAAVDATDALQGAPVPQLGDLIGQRLHASLEWTSAQLCATTPQTTAVNGGDGTCCIFPMSRRPSAVPVSAVAVAPTGWATRERRRASPVAQTCQLAFHARVGLAQGDSLPCEGKRGGPLGGEVLLL